MRGFPAIFHNLADRLPIVGRHDASPGRVLAQVGSVDEDPNPRSLPSDDVHGALNASRLHARYQPIVSASDRSTLALEVLARLDHPGLGMLFPSQFVPQLEDAGLARQLTQAVIEIAFTDHSAHLGSLDLALSLNFPLEVLIQHTFGDWLERRRIEQGIPADQLIIELTESQPVAHLNQTQRRRLCEAMARLRALGYRLAIDDFGPEMPRRQELFTLPFDLLKLDKGIVNDPSHPRMVEQAVRASHQQGFKVVAEGIEETATWTRMQAIGVDYLQGFLVSRPLPCRDVSDWIGTWARQPA